MTKEFLIGATLVLLAGCAGALHNSGYREELSKRASFDMRCPEPQLEFVELSETNAGVINSYGVRGCGRQGTYVRDLHNDVWVLNTEEARGQQDGEPTSPVGTSPQPPRGN